MNSGGKKTILLVEDDALIALDESRILQKYGYRVILAHNGEKAIQAFESSPEIDLILMDINLGSGMDGTRAAEVILQQRDLPLIFLSSHTEREVVELTEGITSYGYIVKDSGETVLIASIKMAFRLFESRVKEKQQAERLRYQAGLLQQISDAVIATDLNIAITSWNTAAEKMYGWSEAEVLGQNLDELLRSEFLEMTQQEAQQQLKAHKVWRGLLRQQRKDGQSLYVQATVSYVEDAAGNTIGGVTVNHDITEEKLAADALRESDRKVQTMIRESWDGFVLLDECGTIVEWNPANERITGLSSAQAIGRPYWEVQEQFFSPAQRTPEHLERNRAMIQQALRTGEAPFLNRFLDIHLTQPSGEDIHIQQFVYSIQTASGFCLAGMTKDLTGQKRAEDAAQVAEARYYTLFEQSHDAVFLINLEGKHLEVNHRAAEMLGYQLAELQGLSIFEVSAEPGESYNVLQRLVQGEEIPTYERLFRKKSGQQIPVEISVELVRGAASQPLYVQSIVRDITERKRAEAALQKAYEEKQALLKELQHRAKNSFTQINSLVELMADASHGEETRAALSEIGSRVRAVAELYQLLYATDSVTRVDLDEYCTRVIAPFELGGRIHFCHTCEAITTPAKTAAALGLILTELVTNAVKHAFPGSRTGTVKVELSRVTDGAVLQIEDDGVGLPADRDVFAGDSLGLQIVQALTAEIKGVFAIESRSGTLCRVTFPLPNL